jgi:hypothetical protein
LLLTGTEQEIGTATAKVWTDKAVNYTARQDAKYYLENNKNSKTGEGIQERIQWYCNF